MRPVIGKLLRKRKKGLLVGLGFHAGAHYHPGCGCSTTRASQCSATAIGRRILNLLQLLPAQALGAAGEATENPIELGMSEELGNQNRRHCREDDS